MPHCNPRLSEAASLLHNGIVNGNELDAKNSALHHSMIVFSGETEIPLQCKRSWLSIRYLSWPLKSRGLKNFNTSRSFPLWRLEREELNPLASFLDLWRMLTFRYNDFIKDLVPTILSLWRE
jgi:hypothetical protein